MSIYFERLLLLFVMYEDKGVKGRLKSAPDIRQDIFFAPAARSNKRENHVNIYILIVYFFQPHFAATPLLPEDSRQLILMIDGKRS
jgi:hypothetical protein